MFQCYNNEASRLFWKNRGQGEVPGIAVGPIQPRSLLSAFDGVALADQPFEAQCCVPEGSLLLDQLLGSSVSGEIGGVHGRYTGTEVCSKIPFEIISHLSLKPTDRSLFTGCYFVVVILLSYVENGATRKSYPLLSPLSHRVATTYPIGLSPIVVLLKSTSLSASLQ